MIYQLAKSDERIFFIGSDLGAGTLKSFQSEMPERFLMEGISEANVIGLAAGLAMEGKIPYVNTISSFLTRRSFEQIFIDICLHNVNVRLIGNGGGLVYAPLGPTHMTTEDLAIMRSIPHMTVIAPADAEEMRRLMPRTVEHAGPIYIRLAKGHDPIVTNDKQPFQIGKTVLMRCGEDALVVTTGITLRIALEAAAMLSENGLETSIVHVPTLKPLDTAVLLEHVSKVPAVVSIEEHSVTGGLGSAMAEIIAEAGVRQPKFFKRLGIPDTFPEKYGSQAELMNNYALTKEHLVKTVESLASRDTAPSELPPLNM
jgi:transketolase